MQRRRFVSPEPETHSLPLLICHDLVIDGEHTEDSASWHTCVYNCRLILARARKMGWRIVHVYRADISPVPVDELRPVPSEPVFQCTGPSIFASRGLRELILSNPDQKVVLMGRSMIPMGLASAIAAADLDVPMTIVTDAVSHSLTDQNDGRFDMNRVAMSLISKFAETTTTAKLLELRSTLSLLIAS